MIYLDNAATTKPLPEVVDAMLPYLTEKYGNPGGKYSLGREAREAVENAREKAAKLLDCSPEEIVFTSGGSEANSLLVSGMAKYLKENGVNHVVISDYEHDSLYNAFKPLVMTNNAKVTVVTPTKEGTVLPEDVMKAATKNTGLVCVMYENNELGTRNDVYGIAEKLSTLKRKPHFHSDLVQAVTDTTTSVKELGIDSASVSGHKFGGVKGTGFLYFKDLANTEKLDPIIFGGRNQEFGKRGGTENVAGIVGLGEACKILRIEQVVRETANFMIRNDFIKALTKAFEYNKIAEKLHFNPSGGKILSLRIDDVDSETMLLCLDSCGVVASSGSACNSNATIPSRTLLSVGLTPTQARSTIRLSWGAEITRIDIENAAKIISNCAKTLINM